MTPLSVKLIRLTIVGMASVELLLARRAEPPAQLGGDLTGNIPLRRDNLRTGAMELIAPHSRAVGGVHHFHVNDQPVSLPRDSPCDHRLRLQFFSGLPR